MSMDYFEVVKWSTNCEKRGYWNILYKRNSEGEIYDIQFEFNDYESFCAKCATDLLLSVLTD
jgi:hypothetical protein